MIEGAEIKRAQALEDLGPQPGGPDYSGVRPPLLPPPAEVVEPDVGKFPYARMILAGIFSGELGARALGQAGSNFPLKAAGMVVSAFPHMVSEALIDNKSIVNKVLAKFNLTGRGVLQNIIEGKQAITPTIAAALTSLGRSLAEKDEAKRD